MQEQIVEIIKMLNSFSEKNKCALDVVAYEYIDLNSREKKYTYQVKVKGAKENANK